MRRYETTFVVNPQADDATIDRQVTAVVDIIKNDGGQILRENRIGTRRLAFPVAGLVQGYYTSIIFESEPGVLPKLERHYKLEEPYVRYLTIKFEGDPMAESHGLFDDSMDRMDVEGQDERPSRYGGYHHRGRHGRSSGPGEGRIPAPGIHDTPKVEGVDDES
ncbi:MAG: 30S ribosomal protein S6 [Candidatus Zixiibacteriota bacterium]